MEKNNGRGSGAGKLRILEISSAFYPFLGGAERVTLELSEELVRRGHEVTVLTTNLLAPDAKLGEDKLGRLRIVRVPNKLFLAGYGFAPGVLAWLRRNWRNFDVVHAQGYNRFATEASLLYLKGKLPTVFTAHGFYHTTRRGLLKKLHMGSIGAAAAAAASACVAITGDDIPWFEKMGVKKEKISIIPNGVDVEKFSKRPKANAFSKYKPFVLTVCRLHESKGLDYLLQAVAKVGCNLVIVGKDGGYKEQLEKKISQLGLRDKVFLAGGVDEEKLVQAYQACEVFALASEWEAFGVVFVEAMAAGKPVVGSDRGGIPYVIEEGRNGFLVPYKDVGKLGEKIGLLLKDRGLAAKMGERGRAMAMEYSWERVGEKTEELYRKLIAARHKF